MSLHTKGYVRMAFSAMRRNRARSLLTILGVIVGVAAVISMIGIGDGIKQSITTQITQNSKQVITVRPASIGAGNSPLNALDQTITSSSLTSKDADQIAKLPGISAAVPLTAMAATAHGDASFSGFVVGANDDLAQVINQPLLYGSYFTSSDSSNNVAVLGSTAAEKLFDQDVPLGRAFTLHGQQFIVDGVLTSFVSTPFANQTNFNNAIFIPGGQAKQLSGGTLSTYEILAKVQDGKSLSAAKKTITAALLKSHDGQHDFDVLEPNQVASSNTVTLTLLTDLVVAAAAISLLVSGIGIMNVMLVSVTERLHEIGVRKAVGATSRQILRQFMTEAAVLSLVGCVIGIIVALVIDLVLRLTTSLAPLISWQVIGGTVLASLVIGILFGSLPAYKAARKDPIAALRNE